MPLMHGLNPDTQKFILSILTTNTETTFMRCTLDEYSVVYARLQNEVVDLLNNLSVMAPSDELFNNIGKLQMHISRIAEIERSIEAEQNSPLFSSSEEVEAA